MTDSNGNSKDKENHVKVNELDTYFASEKVKIPETETVSCTF